MRLYNPRVSRDHILPITLIFLSITAFSSDYGTTGLINIPTARMSNDGELRLTSALESSTNSYSITYQATPWLEGTFRYTGFNDFFLWDRNYEAKIRLWREYDYLPQVSVGIRDMVGTGFWGSEYLVASKEIGDFDITLGMGWGRLAGRGQIDNPLVYLSERFESRESQVGFGDKLATGSFLVVKKLVYLAG